MSRSDCVVFATPRLILVVLFVQSPDAWWGKIGGGVGDSRELQRLATLPRGKDGSEELRVSLDEFTGDDGKPHQYISARLWFQKDGGQWCPTKRGVTIRKGEIRDFGLALRAALDAMGDGKPSPQRSPAPAPAGSGSHRTGTLLDPLPEDPPGMF